jgi:NAD(P)-dependent dehydrogenase (short-subunit alcohol dehydrogenase family)
MAGQVALVTGASRGIGRAITLGLAAAGFDIAAIAWPPADAVAPRALEELERAVVGLGRQCLTVPSDIADLDGHAGIIADVARRFGRLDVFVSNAGIAPAARCDVLEMTPESFDRVLGVNLRGSFFLAQQAARFMLAARTGGAAARQALIFITSVSAERSSVNRAEYCVSKAGLSMAARVLADRLAGQGIAVYEIRPGIVRTDMTAPVHEKYDQAIADGLVPERRWGEPEDVARAVVALARGDFAYSTGMIMDVSGGLSIPRL